MSLLEEMRAELGGQQAVEPARSLREEMAQELGAAPAPAAPPGSLLEEMRAELGQQQAAPAAGVALVAPVAAEPDPQQLIQLAQAGAREQEAAQLAQQTVRPFLPFQLPGVVPAARMAPQEPIQQVFGLGDITPALEQAQAEYTLAQAGRRPTAGEAMQVVDLALNLPMRTILGTALEQDPARAGTLSRLLSGEATTGTLAREAGKSEAVGLGLEMLTDVGMVAPPLVAARRAAKLAARGAKAVSRTAEAFKAEKAASQVAEQLRLSTPGVLKRARRAAQAPQRVARAQAEGLARAEAAVPRPKLPRVEPVKMQVSTPALAPSRAGPLRARPRPRPVPAPTPRQRTPVKPLAIEQPGVRPVTKEPTEAAVPLMQEFGPRKAGPVQRSRGPMATPLEATAGPHKVGFMFRRPRAKLLKPGEHVAYEDVRKHIETRFNLTLAPRTTKRSARGAYYPGGRYTRTDFGDLEADTHELAHHIAREYGIESSIARSREMAVLDYDPGMLRASEGFGEYLRMHLTGEADVSQIAPEFTKHWRKFLGRNPQLKADLGDLKLLIERRETENAFEAIRGSFSRELKARTFSEAAKRAFLQTRNLFEDDLVFLEQVERSLRGVSRIDPRAVDPLRSPTLLARSTRMTAGQVAHGWVSGQGVTNFKGEVVGKTLQDVLRPVADNAEEFAMYAIARRTLELHGRGLHPGISRLHAAEVKRYFEAHKELSKPFQEAAADLQTWYDKVWDYVIDSGALRRDEVNFFRSQNLEYIPFFRQLQGGPGGPAGMMGAGKATHRIGSSKRALQHPLRSIIRQTAWLIDFSDRARVMRALGDMVDMAGAGRFIRRIDDVPQEVLRVDRHALSKALEGRGIDFDASDLDSALEVYQSNIFAAMKRPNAYIQWRNGKPVAFEVVDPDLLATLKRLPRGADKFLWRLFGFPTKLIKAGAVGLRPRFAFATNPLRDAQVLALQSEYLKPHQAMLGLKRAFVDVAADAVGKAPSDVLALYKRSGMTSAQYVGMDMDGAKQALREVLATTTKRKAANIVLHPLDAAQRFMSKTEMMPRLVEFDAAYTALEKIYGKGSAQARIGAMLAAAEVTTDFRRMGVAGFYLNKLSAFWNSGMQGTSRFLRFARHNPRKALYRAISGLTLPAVGMWWLNHDQPWYQEVPEWEKSSFIHFYNGRNPDGSPDITRIVLPFEWGAIFGGLPVAWLDYQYNHGDRDMLKQQIGKVFKTMVPIDAIPTLMEPTVEALANYDFFTGKAIDPPWEREDGNIVDPADRFSVHTTQFARDLGQWTGMSPRQIEHWIDGHTARLATDMIRTYENVFDAKRMPTAEELRRAGRSSKATGRILRAYRKQQASMAQADFATRLFGGVRHPSERFVLGSLKTRTRAPGEQLEWLHRFEIPRAKKAVKAWQRKGNRERVEQARRRLDRLVRRAESLQRVAGQ